MRRSLRGLHVTLPSLLAWFGDALTLPKYHRVVVYLGPQGAGHAPPPSSLQPSPWGALVSG